MDSAPYVSAHVLAKHILSGAAGRSLDRAARGVPGKRYDDDSSAFTTGLCYEPNLRHGRALCDGVKPNGTPRDGAENRDHCSAK